MINLAILSTTQQWGLANATRKANAGLPSEATPWTVQSYTDHILNHLFDAYWEQAMQDGLVEQVIPALTTMPLEQQMQLRAQYSIPNLIPDEYLAQLPQ